MIEEEKACAGPGGMPRGRPYGKGESRTRGSPLSHSLPCLGANRSPRLPPVRGRGNMLELTKCLIWARPARTQSR